MRESPSPYDTSEDQYQNKMIDRALGLLKRGIEKPVPVFAIDLLPEN